LSTKIHAGCRDERVGVALVLTAGQAHASPVFATVLAQVSQPSTLTHAIMDKAYDSDQMRTQLVAHERVPVIPPKSNRAVAYAYDKEL